MPDPTLLLLMGLVAVMAIFMFRNSRKRQAEAHRLQEQMVPGVEVMTSHGIYGTLLSLDIEKNEAIVETTPGTRLRLHTQTITRVIEPEVPEPEDFDVPEPEDFGDATDDASGSSEPRFGERRDEPGSDRKPRDNNPE